MNTRACQHMNASDSSCALAHSSFSRSPPPPPHLRFATYLARVPSGQYILVLYPQHASQSAGSRETAPALRRWEYLQRSLGWTKHEQSEPPDQICSHCHYEALGP